MRDPAGDLARWLWLITPPGAPTVPILESAGREDGIPRDGGPGHVPLLAHLGPPELRRMFFSPRERVETVRALLPPPIARQQGRHAPRAGGARWAIEAAYWRDLRGASEAQIAERLDLFEAAWDDGRARGARRYIGKGRKTLAEVGAWPWALAADGRLARRWWTLPRYAEALAAWHESAFVEVINDALGAVDRLDVETLDGQTRTTAARTSEARALYRRSRARAAA